MIPNRGFRSVGTFQMRFLKTVHFRDKITTGHSHLFLIFTIHQLREMW